MNARRLAGKLVALAALVFLAGSVSAGDTTRLSLPGGASAPTVNLKATADDLAADTVEARYIRGGYYGGYRGGYYGGYRGFGYAAQRPYYGGGDIESLPPADLMLKRAQKNEAEGWDAIWWPDHLMGWHASSIWTPDITPLAETQSSPHVWFDPLPVLGAAAAVTSRIQLGTCVTDPIRRPAAMLAQAFLTLDHISQGRAIMHHNYHEYAPYKGDIPARINGVLISTETAKATGYAIEALQERGWLMTSPMESVYEGQIVGEHCRDNDLPVNICREKKLTNIRNANAEAKVVIKAARTMPLEMALEYIEDDELVEITPKGIRLRKTMLKEADRKKAGRGAKG